MIKDSNINLNGIIELLSDSLNSWQHNENLSTEEIEAYNLAWFCYDLLTQCELSINNSENYSALPEELSDADVDSGDEIVYRWGYTKNPLADFIRSMLGSKENPNIQTLLQEMIPYRGISKLSEDTGIRRASISGYVAGTKDVYTRLASEMLNGLKKTTMI